MPTIEFTGERAGSGPLTWGQMSIWVAVTKLAPADHFLNMRRVVSLSARAAVTPHHATDALARLIERYEALRTRVRVVDGTPEQVVYRAGRLPVALVHGTAQTLDADGSALRDSLVEPAFDHAAEWPVRVGLVLCDGLVRRVAVVISHLAVDGYAMELVLRDLRLLLLRGTAPPRAGRQPLDVAAAQPGHHRASARAVRYWADQYRRIPATMFASVARPADPPYQRVMMTSPGLDAAAATLADRHGTSTSTVFLAATAGLVGALTGHRRCAMETLVHNRHPVANADVVGTLVLPGLLVVDVADHPDLDVLIPRTWRAALLAYANAYYSPVDRDRVIADIGAERGVDIHPYCCFNDVRVAAGAPAPSPVGGIRLTPRDPPRVLHCRFCLELHDTPAGTGVLLTADTRYLPPALIRHFLRALDSVVIAAATNQTP